MTLATLINNKWVALPDGNPVTYNGVSASWGTILLWSENEKNAFGVFTVRESPSPPDGKYAVPGDIINQNGFPVRQYIYLDAPVVEDTSKFIPPSLLRQRAQKIGIWDDLAAYLAQYPSLLLMVLTLENGVDPQHNDLLRGFDDLQVPQEVQNYLLSDPILGVY